jgi:hypothetical protein
MATLFDETCGNEATLRGEVELLLAVHGKNIDQFCGGETFLAELALRKASSTFTELNHSRTRKVKGRNHV